MRAPLLPTSNIRKSAHSGHKTRLLIRLASTASKGSQMAHSAFLYWLSCTLDGTVTPHCAVEIVASKKVSQAIATGAPSC